MVSSLASIEAFRTRSGPCPFGAEKIYPGIDEPSTPDFLPQDAVDRVENAEMERARTLSERLSDLQAADERERHLIHGDGRGEVPGRLL